MDDGVFIFLIVVVVVDYVDSRVLIVLRIVPREKKKRRERERFS